MQMAMNPQLQIWMPAILALFGSLLVVITTAWLNMKALSSQMDAHRAATQAEIQALRAEMRGDIQTLRAEMRGEIQTLRAEMRQEFAELRLEFHTGMSELSRRIERLEEQRGLVRP